MYVACRIGLHQEVISCYYRPCRASRVLPTQWRPLFRHCRNTPHHSQSLYAQLERKFTCARPCQVLRAGPNSGLPTNKKSSPNKTSQYRQDQRIVLGVGVLLALLVTLSFTVLREPLEDVLYGDDILLGSSELSAGDAAGCVLWSVALYFCSPLQLLLLFLGKIETERPSDWALRQLGLLLQLRVNDDSYTPPPVLQAAVVTATVLTGTATALLLSKSLGDATWAVSTGLGACMAAAVYEVGRPDRASPEQAQQLDEQWVDFATFANERLQRTGRCHESEVYSAFRKQFAKYRSEALIPDQVLKDMIRNWHPSVDRTPRGFLKNMSLKARIDPFTGETSGSAGLKTAPAAKVSATALLEDDD